MKANAAKGIVVIDSQGRKTTFLRQRKINFTQGAGNRTIVK